MLTQDEAQKIAKKVLGMSSFPECQVTIASQEQAYTRFANNGITTASFSLRNNLSIVTTRDARTGSYATNDLDDDSLRADQSVAEVSAAISASREGQPDLASVLYQRLRSRWQALESLEAAN